MSRNQSEQNIQRIHNQKSQVSQSDNNNKMNQVDDTNKEFYNQVEQNENQQKLSCFIFFRLMFYQVRLFNQTIDQTFIRADYQTDVNILLFYQTSLFNDKGPIVKENTLFYQENLFNNFGLSKFTQLKPELFYQELLFNQKIDTSQKQIASNEIFYQEQLFNFSKIPLKSETNLIFYQEKLFNDIVSKKNENEIFYQQTIFNYEIAALNDEKQNRLHQLLIFQEILFNDQGIDLQQMQKSDIIFQQNLFNDTGIQIKDHLALQKDYIFFQQNLFNDSGIDLQQMQTNQNNEIIFQQNLFNDSGIQINDNLQIQKDYLFFQQNLFNNSGINLQQLQNNQNNEIIFQQNLFNDSGIQINDNLVIQKDYLFFQQNLFNNSGINLQQMQNNQNTEIIFQQNLFNDSGIQIKDHQATNQEHLFFQQNLFNDNGTQAINTIKINLKGLEILYQERIFNNEGLAYKKVPISVDFFFQEKLFNTELAQGINKNHENYEIIFFQQILFNDVGTQNADRLNLNSLKQTKQQGQIPLTNNDQVKGGQNQGKKGNQSSQQNNSNSHSKINNSNNEINKFDEKNQANIFYQSTLFNDQSIYHIIKPASSMKNRKLQVKKKSNSKSQIQIQGDYETFYQEFLFSDQGPLLNNKIDQKKTKILTKQSDLLQAPLYQDEENSSNNNNLSKDDQIKQLKQRLKLSIKQNENINDQLKRLQQELLISNTQKNKEKEDIKANFFEKMKQRDKDSKQIIEFQQLQIVRLQKEIEQLKEQNKQKEEDYSNLQNDISLIQSQPKLNQNVDNTITVRKQIEMQLSSVQRHKNQVDKLSKNYSEKEAENNQLKDFLKSQKTILQTKDTEILKLRSRLKLLEGEYSNLKIKYLNLEEICQNILSKSQLSQSPYRPIKKMTPQQSIQNNNSDLETPEQERKQKQFIIQPRNLSVQKYGQANSNIQNGQDKVKFTKNVIYNQKQELGLQLQIRQIQTYKVVIFFILFFIGQQFFQINQDH